MNELLIPGVTGLLMGLLLHWAGFSRPGALRDALALRRSTALRSALYALGLAMALTALLCWLAVIDVDGIVVLPLSAGTLAGGVLVGVAAGLCGYTPGTAFAGLGGGAAAEALCVLGGALLAALLLPALDGPLAALQALPPRSDATLFRVTLDEPFLLGGGFRGQACAGLLLMAVAVCVPSPRMKRGAAVAVEPDEVILPEEPVPELPAAVEETFVALLPGEEPLVVDTAPEGEADPPEEDASPEEPGAAAEEAAPAEEPPSQPEEPSESP